MFNPLWSLWSNKIIIARWWNRRSSERCARRSTRQSRRSLMVRAIRREHFSFIHCILNIFSFQWFDWSFRADRLEPSAKLEVGLKDVSLKVEEEKIKWTLGDRSELFDQERLCSRGASLLARTPLCKQMWEERKRACRKTSENNIFCRQRRVCGIGPDR